MLRIGGASAVAGEQYLVAVAQCRDAAPGDDFDESDQVRRGEDGAESVDTLSQLRGDEILHASFRS